MCIMRASPPITLEDGLKREGTAEGSGERHPDTNRLWALENFPVHSPKY